MNEISLEKDWPARRWLLALLGGLIGVAINHLSIGDPAAWKVAFAAFLAVGGVAFAFTVQRSDLRPTFAFSILAALIVGGAIYWNGGPQGWESSEGWRMTCSVLAVAIAAPLFQAWRSVQRTGHAPIWSIPYETAHERAWLSLLIGFAALLFTAITFLLAWLLAALFKLIGLDFIERLLGMSAFVALLIGAAFGGAVGLLRDRDTIIAMLHRVVMLVLSVLAPVMGAALLIFLIALPFTGLAPLWSATRSTTPILIVCVIGALTLANAVIGDAPVDESKNPVLRWGAIALGAAMLPLAIIAAISTGLRISQYGVTPDRLWAVVFTAVACAYGASYALALVRARQGWGPLIRVSNLRLALGLCALATLLSTPLINFGAISTRSQLARLESGAVAADQFDWTALQFDFGAAGKAAVARLAKSGPTPEIRTAALAVSKRVDRWDASNDSVRTKQISEMAKNLTILPKPVALPEALKTRIANEAGCSGAIRCVLFYQPETTRAQLVSSSCDTCATNVTPLELVDGLWISQSPDTKPNPNLAAERAAVEAGRVEVRAVQRRQVFIGGKPAGAPFE